MLSTIFVKYHSDYTTKEIAVLGFLFTKTVSTKPMAAYIIRGLVRWG